MKIRVEINKNIILVFTLLNLFDQAYGDPDKQPLRGKVRAHFKDYQGGSPRLEDYVHAHKLVVWALTVGDPPKFETKNMELNPELQWHIEKGATILPYLREFYENTDFEGFYKKISAELEGYKIKIAALIKRTDIVGILEHAWGIKVDSQMVIIPNPLALDSFGPEIGSVNYQVLGVPEEIRENRIVHTIIHEGSHPIVAELTRQHEKLIEEKAYLLSEVQKHPKYPKAYNTWNTCFEEHLIRAVQMGFVYPRIREKFNIDSALQHEIDNAGMVYIKEFYEVLCESDSVQDAIPKIVASL
jgi:hypothetical protein